MFKAFTRYKTIDSEISNVAIKVFNWHTWYLVEELIPLSLFAKNSDERDKEEIQTLLLKYKDQELQTSYTKPQLPLVNTENVSRISSFCGPKSMLFFVVDIFNIKTYFMNHPVGEWENLEDYDSAKHLVKSLQVTNDCSEHAIKLCKTFYTVQNPNKNCSRFTR